jgi:nitroimidazol reductase NimA-like FMN-containing flavoprotein (pyridoxamine 5'-phosphate oxidase superfamily)
MMRANPKVCFEVDEHSGTGEWRSVIVQGVYEELRGNAAAQALALLAARFSGRRSSRSRTEGRRAVAFRIRANEVTGRCVRVGAGEAALARLGRTAARSGARG